MSAPQPAIDNEFTTTLVGPPAPAYEHIAQRAYQLWQTRLRHGIEGTAEQDWLAAEQELSDGSASQEQPDV